MSARQIGLGGAVAVGLASMLGAGVFVVFRDAAVQAGQWLYLAIAMAALVAILNASAVYQLAKQVDRPGGVYAYSRVFWGPTPSFIAGFAFVFGKVASIAAIALAFAEYLAPGAKGITAAFGIAALAAINLLGINRTAVVAGVLAVSTTSFLVFAASVALSSPVLAKSQLSAEATPWQILTSASIVFFAFAGYARVATLGNEVRDAKRLIPKAIAISLAGVLVLYLALALAFSKVLGSQITDPVAPFVALLDKSANYFPSGIVILVAAAASLGSILALLAGVSRTAAAMAEDGELPKFLHHKNSRGAPWVAETLIAAGAISLAQVGELSWVIGFSSFSVLIYYAIGQLSAARMPQERSTMPKALNWLGFALCLALLVAVPGPALPVSAGILTTVVIFRRLLTGRPKP